MPLVRPLISLFSFVALTLGGALPLSGVLVWYLSEQTSAQTTWLRGLLQTLAAVPTAVTCFVALAWVLPLPAATASFTAIGPVALLFAIMEVPHFVLVADQLASTVADEREAAIALGATGSAAQWHVVLPALRWPLVSVLARGTARLLGETAVFGLASTTFARVSTENLDRTCLLTPALAVGLVCCLLGALAVWCSSGWRVAAERNR